MTRPFDVAVIGLGVTGSAILSCIAPGRRVAGIDRFAPPHALGSSHGENRIIRGAPGEGAIYAELAARAFVLFGELGKRAGRPLLRLTGGFDSATAPSTWTDEVRAICAAHGVPFETMGGREFNRRHPNFALPNGADIVLQSRYGHVAAELSWAALLNKARAGGAELFTGRVVRAVSLGESCVVTFDDGSSLEAGQIVFAAGSWVNDLLDIKLKLRVERRVLAWYPVTEPRGAILPFCFVDGPRNGFWYGMPSLDGSAIKIGEHHHFSEIVDPDMAPPPSERDAALLDGFIARHTRGIVATANRMATCKYTLTGNGDFIIDRHPMHENVLIFACCSGHGFKYAPVYGEIADALLHGQKPKFDLSPFAVAPHLA